MAETIRLTINGQPYEHELVNEDARLLEYLRDELHLTGTKRGCNEFSCGACTVLVNGKAERACHKKLAQLDGAEIVTIEGLGGPDGELDYIQKAFVEHSAVQCGFCTPGIIMAAHSLLNENDNPTEEEIKKALRINLCRCGTYPRVISAVQQAAAEKRGDKYEVYRSYELPEKGRVIGKSQPRRDFVDKVTGKTMFFADYYFDNMMYGKAVYSEYPHARVLSVDTKPAYEVDGVVLAITHEDVPGAKKFGGSVRDQPVMVYDIARHRGEMIAVVFAETQEAANAGAEKIKVEYEVLPGVFSIEEALAPDAPIIPDPTNAPNPLDGLYTNGEKGNICREVFMKRGDIEKAFAESDAIVEADFSTPWEEHAWIEVDGTISRIDEEGRIAVYAPNQDPFGDLEQLCEVLGKTKDEVRVIHTPCGGGFGGKLEITTHAVCAIATLMTGRPAKMVLHRKDSFRASTKRHPYKMHYKLGINNDGKLTALQCTALCDGGPYVSWSHRTIEQGISWGGGPYEIPVIDMTGVAVYTNNPVCGAMRGFGANQTIFAMEATLDMAAEKIGMDPITVREINGIDYGKMMTSGQIMDKKYLGTGYLETLKILRREYEEKMLPMKEAAEKEGRLVGIGFASGWRSIGGGMGRFDSAGTRYNLRRDGRVTMRTSCVEMGAGSLISLNQMAAESSGVKVEDFDLICGDTSNVPYGGHVSASRGVFLWGYSTMNAGKELKEKILEQAGPMLDRKPEDLDIIDSVIMTKADQTELMTLKEFAEKMKDDVLTVENSHTLSGTCPVDPKTNEDKKIEDYRPHYTASYTTAGCVVEVDPKKGNVDILHVTSIMEAGEIINPEAAATQVEGCVIMGAGYAMNNKMVVENGIIKTDTLGKVKVPRFTDMPKEIDVFFAEEYDNASPSGAKGLAEIGVLSMPGAVTNAIYDAVGYRVNDLPVSDHTAELKEAAAKKLAAQ